MKSIGFTCFTTPTPVVVPTIKEQVLALSTETRTKLLNHFIMKSSINHASHEVGLNYKLVEDAFNTIDNIQDRCRLLMRGESITTPEVSHIDPTTQEKVIDTSAVYNTPPTTKTALKAIIKDEFNTTFPNTFSGEVAEAMFLWSKYNGTGDFAFYKSQIIL